MNSIVALLITLLVTAISLLIISKLPTGVEIDTFGKAIISAIVFGLVNAFLRPLIAFLSLPITFITFGLFSLVINAIVFAIAAFIVPGFRLRWGFWSALIGSFALAVINSFIFRLITV
jgi:putative membrane protein